MSITKNTSIQKRSIYSDIGISVSSGTANIDVIYTVISVTVNADLSASARVKTELSDSYGSGEISIQFTYSGNGNPISDAENYILEN